MPKFQPGQSGNLLGRPRTGQSLAGRIRKKGGPDGRAYVEMLHAIATNEDETTRLRIDAIKVLLDRGYGSPPQEVHLETSHEVMRATQLREVLRAEGLLPTPAAPQEQARRPELDGWLRGDLDWNPD